MKLLKVAAIAAVAALAGGSVAAETVLIHGEAGPNRGARAKAIQWFADQVSERSAGDVRIDVQWGGALFKANAALQSIHDGVADMGTIISVYYPKEFASYGIADLPLNNPDAWVGMRATDELFRSNASIKAVLDKKNLVYIGTFTTSQVNIGCKNAAIRSVADIDGLKVRGVGVYGKVFGDVGANMVRLSIYDAYQGLDSGLLDCSQGYSYAVSALKQDEVMTSYTLLNWGQIGGVGTFMNKESFDALSANHQAVLLDAGSDMVDYFGQILTDANKAAIEKMQANGIEVIELAAEERAKLRERGEAYVNAWVETANSTGLDGANVLEDYRGLLAKYASQRDTQGYPWAK
ncbi:MAG: C4-dicarboxylate TRAP transporter substrate-binding protein [Hyphomicrobiales bacterium]